MVIIKTALRSACVALALSVPTLAAAAAVPDPAIPLNVRAGIAEHRIQRTSEPLTALNNVPPPREILTALPPPLSLTEVRKLKGATLASEPLALADPFPPIAPKTAPAAPRIASAIPTRANVSVRDERVSLLARIKTPPPMPVRVLPDKIVMAGGKDVPCRIVGEDNTTLRVELDNGVILDMPKRRIEKIVRKTPTP